MEKQSTLTWVRNNIMGKKRSRELLVNQTQLKTEKMEIETYHQIENSWDFS